MSYIDLKKYLIFIMDFKTIKKTVKTLYIFFFAQ